MGNVFFHILGDLDEGYDSAADLFFEYLYNQILQGNVPKSLANEFIPVHVATYTDNQDVWCGVVVQHAGISEKNPLESFFPPVDAVADVFYAEMIAAQDGGCKKDTKWGYVDRSNTLAKHFSSKGCFDKVRIIEEWTGIIAPEQMHDALAQGNFAAVTHVIRNGGDPNTRNSHGDRPPISYVRTIEHFDGMIMLGADPTIIDGFGDDVTYLYKRDEYASDANEIEPGLKQYAYGFISQVYELYGRPANIPTSAPLTEMDKIMGIKVPVDKDDQHFIKGQKRASELYNSGLLREVSLGQQKNIDSLSLFVAALQGPR